MPTFAGFFHGDDIVERKTRGVLGPRPAVREQRERRTQRAALLSVLGLPATASCDVALARALSHLGKSDATFVQVALEDLWGEREPQNVPGTFAPERNFCRRTKQSLDHASTRQDAEALIERLARARAQKNLAENLSSDDGKMRTQQLS
jgi:4-alpha-glucanotransferase